MNSGILVKIQIWRPFTAISRPIRSPDFEITISREFRDIVVNFTNFFATSYIAVTSKQWIDSVLVKIQIWPRLAHSLGQSDRSILKSRYLVNHWSDFPNFLQRVTFPWSLNCEFRYFGQNSNLIAVYRILSANSDRSSRKSRYLVNRSVRFFYFFPNELHFHDL